MKAVALCISILAAILLAGSAFALAAGDPDKGNEIFDEQCAACHHAYSTDRKVGPGLKGLFAKETLESNGKPANEANIIERIENGGKGMPAFKGTLSDQDRADLIAYLKTL
jgi:cytochrome c2